MKVNEEEESDEEYSFEKGWDSDEEEDDYAYCCGGIMNMYDSRIDHIDDILTVKETLQSINKKSNTVYEQMLKGIENNDEEQKMKEILNTI